MTSHHCYNKVMLLRDLLQWLHLQLQEQANLRGRAGAPGLTVGPCLGPPGVFLEGSDDHAQGTQARRNLCPHRQPLCSKGTQEVPPQ